MIQALSAGLGSFFSAPPDEEAQRDSQRRLEIARALAAAPSLVLMDEPTSGLNRQEADDMTTGTAGQYGVRLMLEMHGEWALASGSPAH